MDVLYIHGFGGSKGGPLEEALSCAVDRRPDVHLGTFRWPSGDLRAAAIVITLKNLPAILMPTGPCPLNTYWTFSKTLKDATRHWQEATAASEDAAERLLGLLEHRARAGLQLSIIAFSLGTRVLLEGLTRMSPKALGVVRRAVFAGGALPWAAIEKLPLALQSNDQLINVYSKNDLVLKTLYPLVNKTGGAAGLRPVPYPGIRNVELSTGHRGYSRFADNLLDLAAGSQTRDN